MREALRPGQAELFGSFLVLREDAVVLRRPGGALGAAVHVLAQPDLVPGGGRLVFPEDALAHARDEGVLGQQDLLPAQDESVLRRRVLEPS